MSAGEKFERLIALMVRLRAPDGCPWDREQTFDSIKPYTLEETYEVLEAIDARDWPGLREELGDFLLQAVFFAQIAQEQGLFEIGDSLDAINAKLVRRHPHIFSDGDAKNAEEVKRRWDQIKQEENEEKGKRDQRLLDNVPRNLPALMEADKLGSRAATVGFDWPDVDQVLEKLHEEVGELAAERQSGNAERMEDELGDVLFNIVNVARKLKIDPEQALRRTNRKFRSRFEYIETNLLQAGKSPAEATLDEMEQLWQAAKTAR